MNFTVQPEELLDLAQTIFVAEGVPTDSSGVVYEVKGAGKSL